MLQRRGRLIVWFAPRIEDNVGWLGTGQIQARVGIAPLGCIPLLRRHHHCNKEREKTTPVN
jgi:hypothetical protein